MIGRAAQSNPWIFREINYFLNKGKLLSKPDKTEIGFEVLQLLNGIYQLYGFEHGTRVARKHIRSMIYPMSDGPSLWQAVNKVKDANRQYELVKDFFA